MDPITNAGLSAVLSTDAPQYIAASEVTRVLVESMSYAPDEITVQLTDDSVRICLFADDEWALSPQITTIRVPGAFIDAENPNAVNVYAVRS